MDFIFRNNGRNNKSNARHFIFLLILVVSLFFLCFANTFNKASAAPPSGSNVTVTSPTAGSTVSSNVTISGTYSSAYGLQISFNAGTFYDIHMNPNGDESGTWSYTLDISKYSGNVEIIVRGYDVSSRYFVWGTPVNITVNNNAASVPVVMVTSPSDASSVSGTVPINITVTDANAISSVQVRINGGAWQAATSTGGNNWTYSWSTTGLGNITSSIETQATNSLGIVGKSSTTYVKVGTGTNDPVVTRQLDRSMWIWEPASVNLVENASSKTLLQQFTNDLNAMPNKVHTLYLYADQYDGGFPLLDNPAGYRTLISWAHANGYYVHALLGSSFYDAPFYAYTRYQQKAVGLTENIINYNIASAPNERFDGINVDIEPHGLPDWVTGSPSVQVQYLTMLQKMENRVKLSGENLILGPAIPRWFDSNTECKSITFNGKKQNMAYHVIDIADYVSIMDYRNVAGGPSGIISNVTIEMSYADSTGKPIILGVETDDVNASGDPGKISFYSVGRTVMEGELSQVYTAFASDSAFKGIAMHHYDSFRFLKTIWSPTGTSWTPGTGTSTPSTVAGLTATNYDYSRNDLHWNRSSDTGTDVDHYNVYRSTTSGFTPSSGNLVKSSRFNFAKDSGLLASTTYYYKVTAVNAYGNEGIASSQVSIATPAGSSLQPMHISVFTMTGTTIGSVSLKVVNASGQPIIGAIVQGNFDSAADAKSYGKTNSSGIYTDNSNSISQTTGTISFVPERIIAPGYYWASSLDIAHAVSESW